MNLVNKGMTALCVSMLVGLMACAAEPVGSSESDDVSATTETVTVTTETSGGPQSTNSPEHNCRLNGYFCVAGGEANCRLKGGIVITEFSCGQNTAACCDF